MSYNQITNGEIDTDSPGDTTLFTKIRDNIKDHVHGQSDVVGIGNPLGAWTSRSSDTVYQAATDLIVVAHSVTGSPVEGFTDGGNPPTTKRVSSSAPSNSSICFPVRKNDYWKVINNVTSLYEIAIGT